MENKAAQTVLSVQAALRIPEKSWNICTETSLLSDVGGLVVVNSIQ